MTPCLNAELRRHSKPNEPLLADVDVELLRLEGTLTVAGRGSL
jgi:hypothetical protein